ncbi:MAG: hypothetical protein ACYDCJ_12480 [Gammaproteobacteria bacterium]
MADLHIRIPDDLAAKIKAQAKANLRSLVAEATFLLREALK